MQPNLKKILRVLSLDIRHTLEGFYDNAGVFHPGDLETRLNALGVWRDRPAKPLDELPHLPPEDKAARQVIDAYIAYRAEAEVSRAEAVAEFVREAAYNWANRLLALRCKEARGLIDEVILQKEIYGGRSLVHNRLARKNPPACAGPDEGLFAMLFQEFEDRARELPELFAPASPAIALRPSLPALKRCLALLSGAQKAGGQEAATDEVFSAPDALGWAYQYWNTEEKDRVFEKVRTQKGAKIAGADIIPATQLYTEPYMVKFLVQNSLGATWMGMHPGSHLSESWEYYVKDADRAPVDLKPIQEITLLDPALGSGHFHLEAFDLFFPMYREEHPDWSAAQIAASILNHNLYGIDIDERAVQIAAAALWMKAKEYAPDLQPEALTSFHQHLVATNIRLPKGKDHLKNFLAKHPEAAPLQTALEVIFEGLENVHELGSLVQIEELVEKELRYLREKYEGATKRGIQASLFEPVVVQGELPLGVESYEEWKANTLTQLERHFNEEGRAVRVEQAYFGLSASKGLALFTVVSQRFDIVTANPPYMGSKNMGPVLRPYVEHHFKEGKRDLGIAFILRCLGLTKPSGRVAMVTQQSWMFLNSFIELRAVSEEKLAKMDPHDFKGLLRQTSLEALAHLGPRAFGEISGEVVNIALFVFSNTHPGDSHHLTAFRLTGPKSPEEKESNLKLSVNGKQPSSHYFPEQRRFLHIAQSPLTYWLGDHLFELFLGNNLEKNGEVRQGLATANDDRFLRFTWETPDQTTRWVNLTKGGGYCKWFGQNWYHVDWENNGSRLRNFERAVIRNPEYYFKPGWSYSLICRGSLSIRRFDSPACFGHKGPGIFAPDWVISALQTHIVSFMLRSISPQLSFEVSTVLLAPLPEEKPSRVSRFGEIALNLKRLIISENLTERSFDPKLLAVEKFSISAILHTIEGQIEQEISDCFHLTQQDLTDIFSETGKIAGSFPIIIGYDILPTVEQQLIEINGQFLLEHNEFQNITQEKLKILKTNLENCFRTGPNQGSDAGNFSDEQDNEENQEGFAHIPIPTETFLEELSQRLQIHPISVYWLLKEGIEQEGWRCFPEEKRISEDRFTVLVLHLLGHRWPKQIEAVETIPDWADLDGIIPLTSGLKETNLLGRIRLRLPEEFPSENVTALEREFEEIMGESLEKWLSSSFFKQHISQFKKRPIAWQLSSRPANGAGGKGKKKGLDKAPAFACLVYYHKLDHNTLTALQSQYARPLRQSCETELRTLDGIILLTPDQTARRIQLEAWIDELKDFEARLEQCAREGFAGPALAQVASKEPLDRWTSRDGQAAQPAGRAELEAQEMRYDPDLNDGVRVNIAPLQKYGLLAAEVLDAKDLEKAITDRAEWRADERRWCRDGKLPQPGWWR